MIAQDIAVSRGSDGLDYPVFVGGDFSFVASDEQHIQDIFEASPGWYKEFPLLGVSIKSYQGSAGKDQEIQTNGSLMLRSDGYSNPTVSVNYDTSGNLNIETSAVRS